MSNQQSIKETLNVIKKALEDENSDFIENNEDILMLNKLIKDDGTIEIIEDNNLNKNEIKEILNQNISKYFENNFDKWLDNNIPKYLDNYFNKKNNK